MTHTDQARARGRAAALRLAQTPSPQTPITNDALLRNLRESVQQAAK